jgi:hypothetical protein
VTPVAPLVMPAHWHPSGLINPATWLPSVRVKVRCRGCRCPAGRTWCRAGRVRAR